MGWWVGHCSLWLGALTVLSTGPLRTAPSRGTEHPHPSGPHILFPPSEDPRSEPRASAARRSWWPTSRRVQEIKPSGLAPCSSLAASSPHMWELRAARGHAWGILPTPVSRPRTPKGTQTAARPRPPTLWVMAMVSAPTGTGAIGALGLTLRIAPSWPRVCKQQSKN